MYFLTKDQHLLKEYNTIWDKAVSNIKKEFDSKAVYNKKILKIRIKSYGDEATDFHYKEISNVGSDYNILTLSSASVFKRM